MLILALITALLHPVHETVSEVEWNDATKRFEVAMRLDSLDAAWIRRQMDGKVGEESKWALPYLAKRFRIAERPKKDQTDPSDYHWVGVDKEGSHVWWYFEIEPGDAQPPQWIDVSVLFGREDNYLHRILILGTEPTGALELSIQRSRLRLDQAQHDSKQTTPARR